MLFGNGALVDCDYIFVQLLDTARGQLNPDWFDSEASFKKAIVAINRI